MLAFDNQETFDARLKMLDEMTSGERKTWEENLGFKSFDRLIHEIIDTEIAYTDKFESLAEKELEKAIESGVYKPYSPSAQRFIEKGIVKIVTNENGEEYMDFKDLMYPMLINENGFIVVGNEIRQFTENQYKVIKSKDYSKIQNLNAINNNIDNNDFFVTDITDTRNKSIGVHINKEGTCFTNKREQVSIKEYARSYETWTHSYRIYYTVRIDNWKKNWWGNWKLQYARTWYSGNFKVTEGYRRTTPPYAVYYITKNYSFGDSDVNIQYWHKTVYETRWYYGGYITPEYMIPTFPTPSLWSVVRWGGSHGLGVRIIDHIEVERF